MRPNTQSIGPAWDPIKLVPLSLFGETRSPEQECLDASIARCFLRRFYKAYALQAGGHWVDGRQSAATPEGVRRWPVCPSAQMQRDKRAPLFPPPSQTGCSQARGTGFPLEFPFNRVSVTTVKLVKKTVWAAEKYTQGRTGNEDA